MINKRRPKRDTHARDVAELNQEKLNRARDAAKRGDSVQYILRPRVTYTLVRYEISGAGASCVEIGSFYGPDLARKYAEDRASKDGGKFRIDDPNGLIAAKDAEKAAAKAAPPLPSAPARKLKKPSKPNLNERAKMRPDRLKRLHPVYDDDED